MARNISSVSGTPSIKESPFQMTPSQSKMNVSVASTRLCALDSCKRLALARVIKFSPRRDIADSFLLATVLDDRFVAETLSAGATRADAYVSAI